MFDNVLLPIDLNHPASWEKALPLAIRLAGSSGTVHVLGIVHDIGSAIVATYLPHGFEERALQHMKAELDTFRHEHLPPETKVAVHVGHGHVAESVLNTAQTLKADVIVMASHPPDDLRHLLVGSYADKVVRHAPVPVMVVR
jgi:nucleotide-binding universal stress UspA family protein